MIYLDHAATTPVKQAVLEAMLPYFCEQFANPSSSYGPARRSRGAIDRARAQVAGLVGCHPEEVYLTSGGSEADNWALWGAMRAAAPGKNHLITTQIEHHAVLRTCQALEKTGFDVTYCPVDADGVVDPQTVLQAIRPQTAWISVMLANNEVGTIQPVREIAEIAHRKGVCVHTDAVQAVGHIPVDMEALGVDLLSLSAHKFYGPKGIGALCIRRGTHMERLVYGGEQERGMRAGTENTAAIVGMGEAARIAQDGLARSMETVTALREELIAALRQSLPQVHINGLGAPRLPGHVHLTIDGTDSALLLMQLDLRGIAASAGSACASGATTRSHVVTAMGMRAEEQADLRLTLGEENTLAEIAETVRALTEILQR